MGFFDLFKRADIDQGVKECLGKSGAILVDVRMPQDTDRVIFPAAEMYRFRPLTKSVH